MQWNYLSIKELVSYISNYTYHPSDYVHGLLASHVYKMPREEEEVNLQSLSQALGHQLPVNLNKPWKIVQVTNDRANTGYYSALYVNATTHQAVLVFQGTMFDGLSDLFRKQSDIQQNIDGILGDAITDQKGLAYEATERAVDYIKQNQLYLSITGHSLGGYLAELGVLFCHRDFAYQEVKGIVFDSPGSGKDLETFQSNIKNTGTKFWIEDLDIVTYLSAPNLINACNPHPGEVYRVYPQLESSDWLKRLEKMARLPLVGNKVQAISKGLLALTGHDLAAILSLFDPNTGKPQEYVRMANWPKLQTDQLKYVGKSANSFPGGHTLDSLLRCLADLPNIRQDQYWFTLDYLDDKAGYQPGVLTSKGAFKLKYGGHYRESKIPLYQQALQVENQESVDWYLYKLWKQHDAINQVENKDKVISILQAILQDYTVKIIEDRPYLSLKNQENQVQAVRDKMRRALEVFSKDRINQAIKQIEDERVIKQAELLGKQLPKLHSYIVIAKLKHYVPRENKHVLVTQQLKKEGICVIYGHGGVGKSTLVAEYGHELKEQQVVYWLMAETRDKLVSSYEKIADELRINYQWLQEYKKEPGKYLSELSRQVYNVIEDRKHRVLLVLDNAVDAALIDECLLHRPSLVKMLITTRNQKDFSNYDPINLSTFTEPEGKTYLQQSLRKNTFSPNEDDIKALIREVGLIPQKLTLAVGYLCAYQSINIQDYISELQKLKESGKKGEGKLVLPEVNLGLETLIGPLAKAQQLMHYAAYLDPDFIPLSLFESLLDISDEELGVTLGALERLSLILLIRGRKGREIGIQIHREVQAACREYTKWAYKSEITEKKVLDSLVQALYKHMPEVTHIPDSGWQQAEIYAPHVAHVLSSVEGVLEPSGLLAKLLNRMGTYSREVTCNYQQAKHYYQKALDMYKNLHSGNHLGTTTLLNKVGNIYRDLGQTEEGLKYLEQALVMRKELYSGSHFNIAALLNDLGTAYMVLGQADEGLKYFKQALAMLNELDSDKHSAIADSLNNIGAAYRDLGQIDKGLNYFKQALVMNKELYKGNHPAIAKSLNNVGDAYKDLGQIGKGLKYFKQALAMLKKFYGGNHPDIATALNNVGAVYSELWQTEEGLKYLQQALVMVKELYKGNHPAIAKSLNNVGGAYMDLGQTEEGLEYFKQAFDMVKELYKGNHPDIASSLNNVGNAYRELGKTEEGLKYLQQAFVMIKELYKGNHPAIATVLNNVGGAYMDLGQTGEGLNYFKQALVMVKELYKGSHPDIAKSLNNVGNAYRDLGKTEEGLKYLQQAFVMVKELYKGNHPDIATALNNVGSGYMDLGQTEEGLKYFKQALIMKKWLYGGNHAAIAISLNNVGAAYMDLGQTEEGLNYFKQAFAMLREWYRGNHPDVATLLSCMGAAYKDLGQTGEGLNYFKQALAMRKELYRGNHPHIANSLVNVGLAYMDLRRPKEGLNYFKQALAMRKELYRGNHPHIATLLSCVGAAYMDLKRLKEGLRYFKQALAMRKELYRGNHPDIATLLSCVGAAYMVLGRPKEALKYFKQALVMVKELYRGNHPDIVACLNNIRAAYKALGQILRIELSL
jgi:tetratricopeptide (TPR) repeat protein